MAYSKGPGAQRNPSQFNPLSCERQKTMKIKSLKIYSQNVRRNKLLTEIILEERKLEYDIILLQEPP